jgi:glycosyltransferase involved in cell wall biosynthesis
MTSTEASMPAPTRSVQSVPVSILIPIKNEASNLARCLASARWADEIVVVDSASTDGPPKITSKRSARVARLESGGA